MIILGITQTNHGSSAAVYDGQKMLATSEERFDRVKFSSGFPTRSINWCLGELDLTIGDIDGIGFYFTGSNYLSSARSNLTGSWRFYPEALYSVLSEIVRRRDMGDPGEISSIHQSVNFFGGRKLDIFFVDHHLAHAAGSYLNSGFQRAAILCMDGAGDGYCMSYGRGTGGDVDLMHRQPFPHSLGMFYSTFTQFLGFMANSDEYKVMGLAAYGNPERYYDRIRKLITSHADGSFELDLRYFSFHLVSARYRYNPRLLELLDLDPNVQTEDVAQAYCDLAAAVQQVTEEVLLHTLRCVREQTGETRLCYGGGVALNCLANGRTFRESGFEDIYVPPNPGDGGLAMGTCAYLMHSVHGQKATFVYDDDCLGPQYSYDAIRTMLDENGIAYSEPKDLPRAVAEHLAAGKIVGHFDGRQEFGPRALGNRSILADPRSAKMKDTVNRKIKYREPFRPFAPSAVREHVDEIFDLRPGALTSTAPESFMLSTVTVRKPWRPKLQAITHADGTARLQVVYAEKNAKYHAIIDAFGRETGVPVVLNTSFNVKGEPIVLSPQDAVRCFYSTGMDSLAVGPYLVEKQS